MEMLTAALAVLCALLTLVLLIQRPSIWPVLLALVVAWGICMAAFRYQLRRWLSRWVRGDNFEKSKTKFSLEQLSQPTALLSGETVLWYNEQFRARLLGGQDMLTSRVQKVLPGLDLQQCRTQQEQVMPQDAAVRQATGQPPACKDEQRGEYQGEEAPTVVQPHEVGQDDAYRDAQHGVGHLTGGAFRTVLTRGTAHPLHHQLARHAARQHDEEVAQVFKPDRKSVV